MKPKEKRGRERERVEEEEEKWDEREDIIRKCGLWDVKDVE